MGSNGMGGEDRGRLLNGKYLRFLRTMYIRCIYGNFGRDFINIRSYYGVDKNSGQPYLCRPKCLVQTILANLTHVVC